MTQYDGKVWGPGLGLVVVVVVCCSCPFQLWQCPRLRGGGHTTNGILATLMHVPYTVYVLVWDCICGWVQYYAQSIFNTVPKIAFWIKLIRAYRKSTNVVFQYSHTYVPVLKWIKINFPLRHIGFMLFQYRRGII